MEYKYICLLTISYNLYSVSISCKSSDLVPFLTHKIFLKCSSDIFPVSSLKFDGDLGNFVCGQYQVYANI